MVTDFITLEQNYFDQAARGFVGGSRTLDTLRRDILASPIQRSYTAWLEAVAAVRPARVLDYCAGMGVHTLTLQSLFPVAEVTGIDISEASLQVGSSAAAELPAGTRRPIFRQMDAHQLDFPDGSFDLVSNFGSFSSLEFDRALTQILRVLAPGGTFVGVETFAHNPLANLKRQINVWRGTRTKWCASHIFNEADLAKLSAAFVDVGVEYHIFFALFLGVLPFRSRALSAAVGRLDSWLMRQIPGLRRYAFKVVFSGRKPG